uniref:Uncharacterized protein n=1 Tax=Rhizophora mucronata TaxID=61149 RepID=A0A2P2QFL4_RHIMU
MSCLILTGFEEKGIRKS